MQVQQIIKPTLMDLCRYTLRKGSVDTEKYFPFHTAQDIIDEVDNG